MTLEILTADALAPLRHGFFTRRGGASSGIFAGLNCGRGSTDQSQAVAVNRARVAAAMGVAPASLVTLHQVHSAEVVVVDAPLDGSTGGSVTGPPRADAMVTATPGLALAVLAADCQPVLFADAQAGVVGAAHAGWKGTLSGVLEATVAAMERLGARRAGIVAVIGPSISQPRYEVGPELMEQFLEVDMDHARFFTAGHGDRMHFDLPRFGLSRLRALHLKHATWTGHCTYDDPVRFYSYRRSVHRREADYGRGIAAIRL